MLQVTVDSAVDPTMNGLFVNKTKLSHISSFFPFSSRNLFSSCLKLAICTEMHEAVLLLIAFFFVALLVFIKTYLLHFP